MSFSDVDKIPISEQGVSMQTLRSYARLYDVPSEIRRYKQEELELLPLPAVLQYYSNNSYTSHHYVVAYDRDEKYVYTIDGTTGNEVRILKHRFPNFWTGVAVIQEQSRFANLSPSTRKVLWCTCCVFISGLLAVAIEMLGRNKAAARS